MGPLPVDHWSMDKSIEIVDFSLLSSQISRNYVRWVVPGLKYISSARDVEKSLQAIQWLCAVITLSSSLFELVFWWRLWLKSALQIDQLRRVDVLMEVLQAKALLIDRSTTTHKVGCWRIPNEQLQLQLQNVTRGEGKMTVNCRSCSPHTHIYIQIRRVFIISLFRGPLFYYALLSNFKPSHIIKTLYLSLLLHLSVQQESINNSLGALKFENLN